MANELIEETMKDIGKYMQAFAVAYTTELLNAKIQGAIEDVLGNIMPEEEKGPNEEKSLEDKANGIKPIAAGVLLVSYKCAWGPDRIEHRYFDMACWSIKPQDSVITNVTFRHRQLLNLFNSMKKRIPGVTEVPFPQKKWIGKKNYAYYAERYSQLQKYYDVVGKNQTVTLDEEWLKFFKLQFDPAAAERMEIFKAALESICKKDSIDWEYAYGYAQRLGLDTNPVDLLKIVAVEKVGRTAAGRVNSKVWEVTPAFIPGAVKAKMANTAENKLYAAISTSVETAWTGIEQGFNKVADTLSETIDKALDPLKEMFNKVLGPCKEFVESKLAKKGNDEDKSDDIDDALKKVKAARFPPLKDALEALSGSGKAAETCRKTMSRVCDLDYTWKYVPYIQYPTGDPILEWFPPIENISEKHQRLTVAMIDVVYVLGRGLCRAFEPLCEYVDKACENFDEKTHESEIAKAVWLGGKRLALDFFSLPYTTWRACWWCGNDITQQVLTFCRQTVNLEADLLGSVASTWKPSSSSDAKTKFAEALQTALDEFIGDRTYVLVTLIRDSSIQLVADLFNEMFGETINKIAETLNDLVSKLPPPLNDLKPGDIITAIFNSLVTSASTAAVKMWAGKAERFIADPSAGEPPSWKEELASKFRCAPRIRNDDDDNSKPEENEEDKKRNEKKTDGATEEAPGATQS